MKKSFAMFWLAMLVAWPGSVAPALQKQRAEVK